MSNNIKVSILMPMYEVEQYLERALFSVFSQTYSDIDYVFVNDCSTDNSYQVLRDTISRCNIDLNRCTIINHNRNEGVAKSRADCIAHAKGDYVYFVDSDDWIEKDAVEQMVGVTNNGTIDIVGCDYMKDFMSGRISYHHENYADTCKENMFKCINYDIATVLWKLLIKKKLFDSFDVSPINIGEDYIMSIKLYFFADSFVSLNKGFYHYVQYNQNRLSFQNLRSLCDHIECVKEVELFCKENGIYDSSVKNQLLKRKFNIKSNFVLKRKIRNEMAFNNTFPEAKGIWHEMNYSWKDCVKFWLAEHGFFYLLNLI